MEHVVRKKSGACSRNREQAEPKTIPPDAAQTANAAMLRYADSTMIPVTDTLALEAPLDIYLNGEHVCATMRTPGADKDLATGTLLSAGFVDSPEAAAHLRHTLSHGAVHSRTPLPPPDFLPNGAPNRTTRARLCITPGELVEQLLDMRSAMEERQLLFRRTGATHCAMFFDEKGTPLCVGEDVGRHNAFDKCLGSALRTEKYDRAHSAVISSRLSHEIVSKAIRTNIAVLAGFSVATSLAVELARKNSITLIGRLRDHSMNIYLHEPV